MFKQIVCAVVLLAFCAHLVYSLECYQCNTNEHCKNPSVVTCNNDTANSTVGALAAIFDFSNTTSRNYECIQLNFSNNNTNAVKKDIRGCIYKEQRGCELTLKANGEYAGDRKQCKVCDGNRCNSAGMFSASTITLFSGILALFLAKGLSH